ncbi:MAG: SRPBCC domain-containing protein [Vicinamibacteria bacterium]
MTMRVTTIEQRVLIAAPPLRVYEVLVSPRLHAEFTGSPASGSRRVGGRFSACDGYISGVHRELVRGERIVQDWSTTEWPEGASPSRLELTLKPVAGGGTELRMQHSKVPASQAAGYRQGWIDYYWNPLRTYFEARARRAPKRRAASRRSTR